MSLFRIPVLIPVLVLVLVLVAEPSRPAPIRYAANTSLVHNQIDHTPYTAISIGWGGWFDLLMMPGLANYSHDNDVSNNLIFQVMQLLSDGGAIYSNGQT